MVSSSVMEPEDNAPGNVVSGPFGNRQPVKSNDGTPPPVTSLYAKMARVMGMLNRLPKNGYNKHFEYAFVSEADIADAVRTAMSEIGIAFFSEIIHWERKPETITRRGKNGGEYEVTKYTTYLQLRFTFACTDTGATIDRIWYSEADDDQDKGISKAVTLAQKYFLKSVFIISTGDNADDPDAGLDKRRAQPAAQQQRQAAQVKQSVPTNGAMPADLIGKVKLDPSIATLKLSDAEKFNVINAVWKDNNGADMAIDELVKQCRVKMVDHIERNAKAEAKKAAQS